MYRYIFLNSLWSDITENTPMSTKMDKKIKLLFSIFLPKMKISVWDLSVSLHFVLWIDCCRSLCFTIKCVPDVICRNNFSYSCSMKLREHFTFCSIWAPRDFGNIRTTGNSCRDTLPCATWHWNYSSIFTCW